MQRATPEAAKRVAVLLLCAALSGCGLKGNLYLPPEPLEPAAPASDEAISGTISPAEEPALKKQTDGRNGTGARAAEESVQ